MRLAIATALALGLMASAAHAETWVMPKAGAEAIGAHELVPELWAVDIAGLEGEWRMFKSYRTFQRAHHIPPGTGVVYDPEPWEHTPEWEQRHPRRYMRLFVREARDRGLVSMLAPSRTLAQPDPQCQLFVKCRYLEIPADYFLLQSQRLECRLRAFRRFVSRGAERASGQLIAELTVAWPEPCVTAEQVVAAHKVAREYTDHVALWSSEQPVYRPWSEQQQMMREILGAVYGTA